MAEERNTLKGINWGKNISGKILMTPSLPEVCCALFFFFLVNFKSDANESITGLSVDRLVSPFLGQWTIEHSNLISEQIEALILGDSSLVLPNSN